MFIYVGLNIFHEYIALKSLKSHLTLLYHITVEPTWENLEFIKNEFIISTGTTHAFIISTGTTQTSIDRAFYGADSGEFVEFLQR